MEIKILIMVRIMSNWSNKKEEDNTPSETMLSYEERKLQIRAQINERIKRERDFLLCGITGNPKVGKSGLAIDCRTEKEKEENYKVLILDLDDGCSPTWYACWNKDENIEIYNPNVLHKDGSANWEETFNNCYVWLDVAKERIQNELIKAVILDGVDKIYEGSGDVLRNHLIKSNKKFGAIIHDTDTITVKALDWKIRNKVYDRLLNPFMALRTNRFLLTHMKPIYDGVAVPVPVGEVPDWYKTTPQRLNQILNIKSLNKGKDTISIATLSASKTNPNLVGAEWEILITSKENNTWSGLEELKLGDL
tara:strand:- start:1679 stop:2599 length:921 start_codon:yes stop_codon:yes gene_type:complete